MNRTLSALEGLVTAVALVSILAVAGCQSKKELPAPNPGQEDIVPAKEAPAPVPEAAAPAPEQAAPAPEVKKGPVWPDPMPENWVLVNDYETPANLTPPPKTDANKAKKKAAKDEKAVAKPQNNLGGEWGEVGFNAGKCALEQVKEGTNTALKITFSMPTETSECGTFEYLMPFVEKKIKNKVIKNYPQFFDLRPYDKITFMAKSGDDKEHLIKLHITELDEYGSQLQGYVDTTKIVPAGKDWERHEFSLDETLHGFFDRRHGKLTGVRVRIQEQPNKNGDGIILIDNIALIKKVGK